MPRLVAGFLVVTVALSLILAGAIGLAGSVALTFQTRATHGTAMQAAAVEYRKARGRCRRQSADAIRSCIADAHAAEDRARVMVTLSPEAYLASLRARTRAAIDAGDSDAIIVEPACNVVLRGAAEVCEIQIRPSPSNARSASDNAVLTFVQTEFAR